jgi:intraflagellar transport protein 140
MVKWYIINMYIGTITIWSEDTRTAKEESSVHKDEVNLI